MLDLRWLCIWIALAISQSDLFASADHLCLTYDKKKCRDCQAVRQVCVDSPYHAVQGCYVAWQDVNGSFEIALRGCWFNPCDNNSRCVATESTGQINKPTFFCCCTTPMCNEAIFYEPKPKAPVTNSEDSGGWKSAIYAVGPVCLLVGVVILGIWLIRRRRKRSAEIPLLQLVSRRNGDSSWSQSVPLNSIELVEVKMKTQRGCVWRGKMPDSRLVAVKILSHSNWDIWAREREVHQLLELSRHPNILEFIGAGEVRLSADEGAESQLWVVTAYHDRGSLSDFLKTEELTVPEAIHMTLGLLSGLTFIHNEQTGTNGLEKPSIVHRDVKSDNILVSSDKSVVISDFGLAVRCEDGHVPSDTHTQVGTARYMAPEVLEGATEFSAFAFKQIDVYASALVLWEILSRCRTTAEAVLPAYQQPYADYLDKNPSVENVQTVVVTERKRPTFSADVKSDPLLCAIAATVEEMWDAEPDARIPVSCAMDRLQVLVGSSDASGLVDRPKPK